MDGGQGREGPLTHLHPTQSFDKIELLECIRRLVEVDQDWVPGSVGTSLYVRPVLIGNEVGRLRGLWSHTWGAGNFMAAITICSDFGAPQNKV